MCISADGKIHLRDVACLVLQMLLFKFWFLFFNTADVTFRFGDLLWNETSWNETPRHGNVNFSETCALTVSSPMQCWWRFASLLALFASKWSFLISWVRGSLTCFFCNSISMVAFFLKILNVKLMGFDTSFWVWEFMKCFVLRWNSFDFSDFSETANCQTLTTFPLKEVFTMKGVPNPIWITIK